MKDGTLRKLKSYVSLYRTVVTLKNIERTLTIRKPSASTDKDRCEQATPSTNRDQQIKASPNSKHEHPVKT